MSVQILFLLVTALLLGMKTQNVCCYTLGIIHTGDIQSQIEEFNEFNHECLPKDSGAGKCYGGVSRLLTKINEARSMYKNSILVDTGDFVLGNIFFHAHGFDMISNVMNFMGYNAMCLGVSEFHMGEKGVIKFANNATFKILGSNLDLTTTPILSRSIEKSTILHLGGEKIGLIGYTTTKTPNRTKPGKIGFSDEMTAIRKEVNRLSGKGINKIILLAHGGLDFDKKIATEIEGVDVIVGGFSETFMYTGDAPSKEEPKAPYPVVVKHGDGSYTIIVHDYKFGKYLGLLEAKFDDDGVLTEWEGNPILLDDSVPKDPNMEGMVNTYKVKVTEMKTKSIGETFFTLEGLAVCMNRECTLGNLMTDAMLHQTMEFKAGSSWNKVAIALIDGGGVRKIIPAGKIVVADILNAFPFHNTADLVTLPGKVIKDALEYAAYKWVKDGSGTAAFLQVSGLRIVYDMKKKKGKRVFSVEARCADCAIPKYEALNMTKKYNVLMNSFIATGGAGYKVFKNSIGGKRQIGNFIARLLEEYVKAQSPILMGLENRIQFFKEARKAICPK